MSRLNEIILFIGRKGVGKTTIARLLAMNNSIKRVFVLDDMSHPAYTDFDCINVSELKSYTGNRAVVLMNDLDETLTILSKYQANAVVIIEDSSRFIGANVSKAVKAFIVNHRKLNFDVYFMYHFLTDVAPYICKQYNRMLLFKTGDNVAVKQNKWANWHTIVNRLKSVLKHPSYNHYKIIAIDE